MTRPRGADWYSTRLPDGTLWAEATDPRDPVLRHPDPTVALTWWRLEWDESAKLRGQTTRYVPWLDRPAQRALD